MSRFWGAADDSESDEESVVSSEEKNKPEFDYLRSSSSESSGKRVVVSEREKRLSELRKYSTEIKNLLKINDWNGVQTNFELLNKELTKAKKMVEKSGVPVCYIRTLVRLEEALKKAADLDRKSLSSVNAKALNIMKQKLKKNNTPYEADIQKYKEKPIESGDEGDDDEEDEDEDEDASASGSDEDDEDDEDEDDEDEDEDDEDEEEETAPKKKKEKKAEKQPERLVWTREVVKRKLTEICASRGKKGSNQFEQISQLKSLAMSTSDIPTRLEVIYVLISTQFDTKNTLDRLPHDQWISILFNAITALDLIESDPSLIVVEESAIGIGDAGDSEEQEENKIHVKGSLVGFCERLDDEYSKSFQLVDPHTQDYVARLKDESLFLLLAVRSESFYQRKGDTQAVNRIALRRIECLYWKREDINPFKLLAPAYERAHKFIQKSIAKKSTVRFKESANENESAEELADQAKRTLGERGTLELTMTIKDVIRDLATQIYKTSDERAKTRAMLCQIYNYALEDCYFEARDLLLMSHLQENIHLADVLTQILFNRSIVQLGLCAFRHGFISDAHSCLCDLFTSGRVKELLAQGVSISRFGEKNWEQEKQAKARQIPFHMHIAIELIDSVHLICAMLLEVPNMAMNTLESKKKIISKPFRKLLDHYKIEVFTGPPENNHDVIVSASKALISGNVDRCWELISSLKVWKLIPNEQKIKDMLVQKIREEGLRAYMFKYSHLYKSISGAHLAETFKLSPTVVHSLISKMIVNEELHASWDQPTDCVVMHRVEPTHFQHLAMQFAEKITSLVESNERILDTKTGSFGYNAEQQKGGRGDHHHHQKDWQGRRNGKNNRYQPRQGGAYYAPPKGSNIIEQSNENEIN